MAHKTLFFSATLVNTVGLSEKMFNFRVHVYDGIPVSALGDIGFLNVRTLPTIDSKKWEVASNEHAHFYRVYDREFLVGKSPDLPPGTMHLKEGPRYVAMAWNNKFVEMLLTLLEM